MSKVTIGCKLPNGIIMQVGEKSVRINGWNNNAIKGGSHGITEGVPADMWEAWRKEYAESRLVKGEFIFACGESRQAEAKARDHKENRSGHEQLPKLKPKDVAGGVAASDER